MVPIRGLDPIGRCRIDLTRFEQTFGGEVRGAAFIFCRETAEAGNSFHARMFAPAMGVHEDPATGSAVAAFAGYLAATGAYRDGAPVIGIEQGRLHESDPALRTALGLAQELTDSQLAARASNNLASLMHLRGRAVDPDRDGDDRVTEQTAGNEQRDQRRDLGRPDRPGRLRPTV